MMFFWQKLRQERDELLARCSDLKLEVGTGISLLCDAQQERDKALLAVETMRAELEQERILRHSAEKMATSHREQAERFEKRYTEAVTERLKSLELVNVKLLQQQAPEPQPSKLQDFHPVPKEKRQIVGQFRMQDRQFIQGLINRAMPPKDTKSA
jgi:hypothetical protein